MSARTKVTLIWIIYVIGFGVIGLPILGFILSLFCGKTNTVHGVAGHVTAQRRLFWQVFGLWAVGIVVFVGAFIYYFVDAVATGKSGVDDFPLPFWISFAFMGFAQIWLLVQSIKGTYRAIKRINWPDAQLKADPKVFS